MKPAPPVTRILTHTIVGEAAGEDAFQPDWRHGDRCYRDGVRILMVTPWFPMPTAPSSGIFVLRDAQAVGKLHDVTVVHLDSEPGAAERAGDHVVDGVSVHRVPFTRTSVGAWSRARRAVRAAASRADIIHTHALTGILPFAFRRPASRTPWVHTEHWSGLTSPETLTPRGRLARRVMMPILSRPDFVVVAADRLARVIRTVRRGPVVNIPCVVIPPTDVVGAPRDRGELRLIGIGGIIPRKGPVKALEAVAELERRGVRASLTWVGAGPQRDELLSRASELGLGDRLSLTGTLDEAGVGRQLDAHDMFILPTLGDNFCIVVAEALSHGRPVVSGADTGAVDYSDPSVSEFVADQTANAYADAVERLSARTASMSADEIAATVRDKFTPERVAQLLTETYSSLVR